MSLIGPRPERPELEHQLELMNSALPQAPLDAPWPERLGSGLSAPYASSIDDSDLKLSYDLYYLRTFQIPGWILVILFRTIKTVLKAGGR